MQLSPLFVLLLAQIFILLLGGWFFSARKKNLLLRELQASASRQQPSLVSTASAFDQDQAALLLNRMYQNMQSLIASKSFSKESCLQQQELTRSLGTCLGIQLDELAVAVAPATAATATKAVTDDLVLQEDLDAILDDEDAEDLDATMQALMAEAGEQPATPASPENTLDTGTSDDLDELLPADETAPEASGSEITTADADEALLEQLTEDAKPPKLADNPLADTEEEAVSMDFDFTDLERELLAEEENKKPS